mgnify:CR=1 FL=1|jgi:PAS domain S-box-containing protein
MAYFSANSSDQVRLGAEEQKSNQKKVSAMGGQKPTYAGCEHRKTVENTKSFRDALSAYERLKGNINFIDSDSLILTGTGRGFPIVHVTSGWVEMCGWSHDEVVGRSANINQGEGTDRETIMGMGKCLAKQQSCKVQLVNYRADGSVFWNVLSVFPVLENGKTVLFVAQLQDYTYELSKLVHLRPLQYFSASHRKGDYFMGLLKSDLALQNSPYQDGRNQSSVSRMVNVVSGLGFFFGDLDPGYVFHRLLDAMLRVNLSLVPDDSEQFSSLGVHTPDGNEIKTTDTVCIKVAIRHNKVGKGSVHIERNTGSVWQFQRIFKSLIGMVGDLIEESPAHCRAVSC